MFIAKQQALVVLHPFGSYRKGQIITDPAAIAAVKQHGQMAFVVPTEVLSASTTSTTDTGR